MCIRDRYQRRVHGTIILGTYFGSEGKYTISMTANDAVTATLVDKETGSQQVLNNGTYSFDANSGTYNDRFLVRLEDVSTSLSAAKVNTPNITVSGGEVIIDSPVSSEINIYAADGTMVSRKTAQHASFALKAGFYLVKVNGVAYKINVPRQQITLKHCNNEKNCLSMYDAFVPISNIWAKFVRRG
eukprot:TRINITY_DN33545_c0_g1_i1.p1 TRINITY_DN33545_c0_g1~~TRINITY_DN33545_c0_g1_i1.p1  ORF type:complete len:186 (+),score=28.92 TRINITY_DN33545_c0_g1_i1:163-720(+)